MQDFKLHFTLLTLTTALADPESQEQIYPELTTEKTAVWITQTINTNKELETKLLEGSRSVTLELVHALALTSLICNAKPLCNNNVPETLLFEKTHINFLKREFISLVCTKAAVAIVILENNKSFLDQVKIAMQTMKAGTVFDAWKLGLPPDLTERIKTSIQPGNSVRGVFHKQIRCFLNASIVHGSPENAKGIFPRTENIPTSKICDRADDFVKQVCCLAKINREVHHFTYNEIICNWFEHQ